MVDPFPTLIDITNLTSSQGIRHQQLRKRNLAEQAFALSRGHDKWIEVGEHESLINLPLLIHIFRTLRQCFRAFPDVAARLWDIPAPRDLP